MGVNLWSCDGLCELLCRNRSVWTLRPSERSIRTSALLWNISVRITIWLRRESSRRCIFWMWIITVFRPTVSSEKRAFRGKRKKNFWWEAKKWLLPRLYIGGVVSAYGHFGKSGLPLEDKKINFFCVRGEQTASLRTVYEGTCFSLWSHRKSGPSIGKLKKNKKILMRGEKMASPTPLYRGSCFWLSRKLKSSGLEVHEKPTATIKILNHNEPCRETCRAFLMGGSNEWNYYLRTGQWWPSG